MTKMRYRTIDTFNLVPHQESNLVIKRASLLQIDTMNGIPKVSLVSADVLFLLLIGEK